MLHEIEGYSKQHPLGGLNRPALLVIDMQNYFIDPDGEAYLKDSAAIIPNVVELIDHFNSKDLPVIFTRHAHKKDSPRGSMHRFWNGDLLYEDNPQSEIIKAVASRLSPAMRRDAALAAGKNINIIQKEHYSAFENTELNKLLKDNETKDIIICGVMTHLCVETTARIGFIKGYRPIIISDATATKNFDMHLASLRAMAHGFGHISTTQKLIKKFNNS
ncbi:MAG: isochorismatase family cysteine hydrolase [Pseudomonadota bacterium]